MPTVWILPPAPASPASPASALAADAGPAVPGDYLLRPAGEDLVEVGRQGETCTWFGSLAASLLPALPQVEAPTEAPEQDRVLQAVQGVESAQTHRGG